MHSGLHLVALGKLYSVSGMCQLRSALHRCHGHVDVFWCVKPVKCLLLVYPFARRRNASTVYAVNVSVCLSLTNRNCIERLNVLSRKQRRTIAHGI